jgi:hypothetical protein
LLDSVDERLRMARARRQHCAAAARLVRLIRTITSTTTSPTDDRAEREVSEALQLALRVVEARGNRPIDPRSRRAVLP